MQIYSKQYIWIPFVVLYLGIICSISIWFFHLFLPKEFHFLALSQINTIENMLLGALITNFAREFYKRMFDRIEKK